jgi:sugar phosphate isomerase/epimerase
MKLSLSTAWVKGDLLRLEEILPFTDALEVGTYGDRNFFLGIERLARKEKIEITSIHASAGPHKTEEESYYTPNISSLDIDKREYDVQQTARSAEWALKIGARKVILHTGKVHDQGLKNDFLDYKNRTLQGEDSSELESLKKKIIDRRKELGRIHLKPAVKGLLELCKSFPAVTFCFETRVHHYEIPLLDEAGEIFLRVAMPNLGYWHDIGHTYIMDQLGFAPMSGWQTLYSEMCAGVHIHDVGLDLQDHYPPGQGILDFARILEPFGTNTQFTLEINSRHSLDELVVGIESLQNIIREDRRMDHPISG